MESKLMPYQPKPKPFDPVLYGKETAKELDKYAHSFKDLTDSINILSDPTKTLNCKSSLGQQGNFSQVRCSMDDDMIIEKVVMGPAGARAKKRENLKKGRDTLLEGYFEKEEQKHPKKTIREWRRHPNKHTRIDTDFLPEIESNLSSDYLQRLKTLDFNDNVEIYKHIGPQTSEIDYISSEIEATRNAFINNIPVKDQLKKRLVRDKIKYEMKGEAGNEEIETTSFWIKDGRNVTQKRQENIQMLLQRKAVKTFSEKVQKTKTILRTNEERNHHAISLIMNNLDVFMRRKNKFKNIIRGMKRSKLILLEKVNGKNDNPTLSREERIEESESLMRSVEEGNLELAKIALEFGADVNYNRGGRTPFQLMFYRRCKIENEFQTKDACSDSYGSRENNDKMIIFLFRNGADINLVDDEKFYEGWAPIHYAAKIGCLKQTKWLIEHQANVNVFTCNGETPLMKACEGGYLNIILLLLNAKAELYSTNKNGMTVLHFAAMSGELVVLEFLLDCGVDKSICSNDGYLAVDICHKLGFKQCTEFLLKKSISKEETTKSLLSGKNKFDLKDK